MNLLQHQNSQDVVVMDFKREGQELPEHFCFLLGDLYDFFTLTKLVSKYQEYRGDKTRIPFFRNYDDQQYLLEKFFEGLFVEEASDGKEEMFEFSPDGRQVIDHEKNELKTRAISPFMAKMYLDYFGRFFVPLNFF